MEGYLKEFVERRNQGMEIRDVVACHEKRAV
jgi:hypothetical protein